MQLLQGETVCPHSHGRQSSKSKRNGSSIGVHQEDPLRTSSSFSTRRALTLCPPRTFNLSISPLPAAFPGSYVERWPRLSRCIPLGHFPSCKRICLVPAHHGPGWARKGCLPQLWSTVYWSMLLPSASLAAFCLLISLFFFNLIIINVM